MHRDPVPVQLAHAHVDLLQRRRERTRRRSELALSLSSPTFFCFFSLRRRSLLFSSKQARQRARARLMRTFVVFEKGIREEEETRGRVRV